MTGRAADHLARGQGAGEPVGDEDLEVVRDPAQLAEEPAVDVRSGGMRNVGGDLDEPALPAVDLGGPGAGLARLAARSRGRKPEGSCRQEPRDERAGGCAPRVSTRRA